MLSRRFQPASSRLFPFTGVSFLGAVLFLLAIAPGAVRAQDEPAIDYARQIQPIFARRCFKCHGPDHAEGGLRLDTAEGMHAELDSGEIGVVPGDPGASEVLARIKSDDDYARMPPEEKPLTEQEADLIQRWIEQGGQWSAHWAYRPLNQPNVPHVENSAWVRNEIDAFVLHELERRHLTPAEPADRVALARRVYFDLIGLPPTPEQVAAFVNDESPDAYEKLIDQLLASDQYGEKWARHWLDVVRYAETNGYERDGVKELIWKYRDYVIRAFNEDKPYDRFLMEQVAGDELPEVTPDSITATGFYRLGIWDDEPADRELAHYDYLDDLVRTTGETFCGMTIGCARCHDHKIDPITQRDYYSMVAFFADISSHGSGKTNLVPITLAAERAAFDARVARKQELETRLQTELGEIESRWRELVQARVGEDALTVAHDPVVVADSREEAQQWRFRLRQPREDWFAIGFDDSNWQEGPGGFGRQGTPGAVVRTPWQSEGIWLRRTFRLDAIPSHVTLHVHHDEDVQVYLNGQLLVSRNGYVTDYIEIDVTEGAMPLLQTGKNVLAVQCRQTGGGQYIDAGLTLDYQNPVANWIERFGPDLLGEETIARWKEAHAELAASQTVSLVFEPELAMAVAERGPQKTWILQRGLPAMKGDEVTPAFPGILNPSDPDIVASDATGTSGKRLALARWLVSDENPLVSRVMVNRIWQHHFGRGLARTTSDFGLQGAPPTHPELLDWLAVDFRESGWRVKRLHKLIMMSNAYQMASTDNADAYAIDPTNDYFWRYDMRRLTAEEIRDAILAVTGTLNLEMYGPPIFPPLSPEVLATASRPDAAWGRSSVEQAARRTIYVHVKRSLRPPMLTNFDAPESDTTCPVRMVTTVPTQSLGMLNNHFMIDQATLLAERLAREAGDDPRQRVALAVRLVMGREATDQEIAGDLRFLETLRTEEQLSEEQVWQAYGLMMLNTNEFIYLD
ncbi:MAG: PSD1 domain-containing protein [Planctomycetales bacterium]|nr:PSD1 domain-containing protein [Planctomycetales bacterium]